jgi:diguanylate cyclase (GGDEF)-like protein/PAS domain S-box-containing protein
VNYLDGKSASWHALLEALADGTALLDQYGVIRDVNENLTTLTGFSRDDLVGHDVSMLVPPRLEDTYALARLAYFKNPTKPLIWRDRDLTVLRKDGSELSVDFAIAPLDVDDEPWVVASIRDNSLQRDAERARDEVERHFRLAFENSMSPMIFTDLEDKIIAANDAFCEMIGRTRSEILLHDSKIFTYPDDIGITEEHHERITEGHTEQARYVKRYLRKDGRTIVVEVSKAPAKDSTGATLYYVVSERDITEERTLTAKLSHQALHDPLTGLANRALIEDRLAQAQARVMRQGGVSAVLLLDLDDFKGVNDTHGHLVGDQLLVALAHRLTQVTRASDTLCRFGGDEFLYLAEGLHAAEEAEQVALRLEGALRKPFDIAGLRIVQHASMGVVVLDAESAAGSGFIEDADVALYEAKRRGKGHHVVFSPNMYFQAVSRYADVQELRAALAAGQLSMHFQPIVDLTNSRVVGFEALMRWPHPTRGWVPPSDFIPLADKSELIFELSAFTVRQATAAAATWDVGDSAQEPPYVTVNLTSRQFHDPGLVALIEDALAASGLEPSRLVIEVTESVVLQEVAESMQVMEKLTRLGVGVALDNFGTGFSSLSYLVQLHPRFIKIDQSFVRPPRESVYNDTLLETIVSLGSKLDMTILAEGIETSDQLGRLRHFGCELSQGFLFSPAVPAGEARDMLGHPISESGARVGGEGASVSS